MTALNGPSYIIYNDISNTLGKIGLLYISIPLFFFWSVFASTVNPEDLLAAISGPIYTLIIVFAVSGYKTLYPIAIGMGSTRKRFLKSFYIYHIALFISAYVSFKCVTDDTIYDF
ncbi:hypothetical protein [Bacillus sp. Marseille-P3800]|uniref:hypothetical protein n=1 Tax=Bacillus sp. Marseille-P3800 TaxID=2014782 RepID=UPI000C0715AE|nr:hypothetical protein [Bacillus sp. Marseille-P3800]